MNSNDQIKAARSYSFPDPLGTKPPQDIKGEYIQDFVLSWQDLLDNLEITALQMESGKVEADTLAKVKRMLHTIKGDAAVIGFPAVSDVFHRAEDVLSEQIDKGECPTEYLLALKDWLQQVIPNLLAVITGPQTKPPAPKSADPAPQANQTGKQRLKVLIVEDDFTGRLVLQKMLAEYAESDLAVDGKEALITFSRALAQGKRYDLIFLDIMMPEMSGQDVLKEIRRMEAEAGILGLDGAKIVMTTALGDRVNVMQAFREQCDGYLVKPIEREKLFTLLGKELGFRV